MSKILKINLDPSENEIHDYEKEGQNLMYLSIQLPDGKVVSGNAYSVQIAISIDGMMGLGTELIRKAKRLSNNQSSFMQETEELSPVNEDGGSQGQLGVFLTHDSCNLIFSTGELGCISEELVKAKSY